MLQWGRRVSAAESGKPIDACCFDEPASMGPPRFSGGKDLVCGERRYRLRGFNGAAAFQRRKAPTTELLTQPLTPLQWGRRVSAAESLSSASFFVSIDALQWGRRVSAAERLATMACAGRHCQLQWGRRVSAAERLPQANIHPAGQWSLQWGRRVSAAESAGNTLAQSQVILLQWGRRVSAAESHRPGLYAADESQCFNGAAAFQRRKGHSVGSGTRICRTGFNGAAAFQRRKARSPKRARPSGSALQWGRRVSAAERSTTGTAFSPGARLQWGRRVSAAESLWPPWLLW